jgi:hypothetical protein
MSDAVSAGNVSSPPKEVWWRFPSTWIVGSSTNEALFSKAVWLILPLQYYVVSKFPTGLQGEYIAVALVSVVSIASLFGASLLFALFYYRAEKPFPHGGKPNLGGERRVGFSSRYALIVRMWAIALIVSWMAVHVVLAISYALGTKGDLLEDYVCQLFNFGACYGTRPDFSVLTIGEYFAYTIIAVALLAIAGVLHRRIKGPRAEKLTFPEPNIVFVIVTVTALLTVINNSTIVR